MRLDRRASTRRTTTPILSDINVTPLVDVMLVLLIIFMVTAPMLHQGIEVALPKAEAPNLPLRGRGSDRPVDQSRRARSTCATADPPDQAGRGPDPAAARTRRRDGVPQGRSRRRPTARSSRCSTLCIAAASARSAWSPRNRSRDGGDHDATRSPECSSARQDRPAEARPGGALHWAVALSRCTCCVVARGLGCCPGSRRSRRAADRVRRRSRSFPPPRLGVGAPAPREPPPPQRSEPEPKPVAPARAAQPEDTPTLREPTAAKAPPKPAPAGAREARRSRAAARRAAPGGPGQRARQRPPRLAIGAAVAGLDNPDFTYGYYVDQMLAHDPAQLGAAAGRLGSRGDRALPHPARRPDRRRAASRLPRASTRSTSPRCAPCSPRLPLPPLPRAFREGSLGVNLIFR